MASANALATQKMNGLSTVSFFEYLFLILCRAIHVGYFAYRVARYPSFSPPKRGTKHGGSEETTEIWDSESAWFKGCFVSNICRFFIISLLPITYQLYRPTCDSVWFKHLVITLNNDTSSFALQCCASTLSHLKSNYVWTHDQQIPSCTNRNKQSPRITIPFHKFHTSFQMLNKPMEKNGNSPTNKSKICAGKAQEPASMSNHVVF